MSFVPVVELGMWNAWIFMLFHFLPMPLLMMIHRGLLTQTKQPQNGTERTAHSVAWILWLATAGYSVFLPLRPGTRWFYLGVPVTAIGLITYSMVIVSFATTRITTEPIRKGIYRYSRHPMYATQVLLFVGVGLLTASWLFLVLSLAYAIVQCVTANREEQACLATYENTYRDYLQRTPKWIGLPRDRASGKER